MHDEDTQRHRLQRQRNVGATAQATSGIDIQTGDIRVDAVADAAPHRDTDSLHDMIVAQVDRVLVGREHPGGDAGTVHFLHRDHVGIQFARVTPECLDVFRLFRVKIGRQFPITGRSFGEPFEIPGRQLQVRRDRDSRLQRDEQQRDGESAKSWDCGVCQSPLGQLVVEMKAATCAANAAGCSISGW